LPQNKGLLAQAAQFLPAELLIPVAPPSAAKAVGEKAAGKAPAFYTGTEWRLLPKWELGCSAAYRDLADEKKANVGLLLGLPQRGHNFVVLDLDLLTDDTNPEALQTRVSLEVVDRIIKSLQNFLQAPLWVRLTKVGRAAILFDIAEDQPAGRKSIVTLSHPAHQDLGKLEVLATGNQCCIAGIHPVTRKEILWYRTDAPDKKLLLPDTSAGVYTFESRNALDTALGVALAYLARSNVTSTVGKTRAASTTDIVSPEDQAPPSAVKLLDLLEVLPHPGDLDRDSWVSTMYAVAGCMQALIKLKRVTAEELAAIKHAALQWSCRWEDPAGVGTNYAEMEAKWNSDFGRASNIVAGWHSLINLAVSLGLEDLRAEEVAERFAQFELDPPAPEEPAFTYEPIQPQAKSAYSEPIEEGEVIPSADNAYIPADMLSDPHRPRKRNATDFNVPESDIMIVDSLEKILKGKIMFREDLKKWMAWQGARNNWGVTYGERVLRRWIENALTEYSARHFNGMENPRVAKFVSGARIDTMEKMLRFRLGKEGPGKANIYFLQTPVGAYDLRDGSKLPELGQRALEETRTTTVKPEECDTPIFDNIVSLVCAHDADTINWLWHYLGYLILGDPLNHNMLVIHGSGGNGKGALCRTIQKCLGNYAIEASRDLVIDSAKNKHKTALYDLMGKRIWFVSEISPGEAWNEAQVKSLTGGDQISANRMHHDMEYFYPEGTFIVATNNLPKFHKIDDAIVRRFLVISSRLTPTKKDVTIEKKVQEAGELRGILFKLIKYAAIVYQNNFELPVIPEAMDLETKRYFADQDSFYTWFDEECDTTGLHSSDLTVKDLQARFENYVRRKSHLSSEDTVFGQVDSLSEPQFVSELKRRGCVITRMNGEATVMGVRFKVGPVKAVA
jgi:P4 family phage/plasmid primase-like protien